MSCQTENTYILADGDRLINEKAIRWVKRMDQCLKVCTRTDGCSALDETSHTICKINNPDSFERLNNEFFKNDVVKKGK